jgi:UDP-N-acetylmuramate: L-alanyl-gamma-D-glutamyl-meso-diaminopimelate ligase
MNLKNKLEGHELLAQKSSIKKIFFYRICGTGMGACACILKEAGFDVSGADASFSPPMSTYLESTGIPCYPLKEVNAEFLKQFDLIVVGNSVPRVSEHATLIEECGVPFTSFPSILGAYVLKNRNVIGVAGTHGKTTTTFLMTQLLESLGRKPGYFIGGIIDDRAPSSIGQDDFFVIESDEYDSAYFQKYSKFRLYELNNMILTSLEFDHADIYSNVEQIEAEFEAVIPKLESYIVANNGYPSILKLKNKYPNNKWIMYGQGESEGPRIKNMAETGISFELTLKGENILFKTNLVGEHNILNLSSCLLLLSRYGFGSGELQKAVTQLQMVKRRQELRGYYKESKVIDDFAHHPRAISLTVDAIKMKYPKTKIITVFEPISATARSNVFQKEFAESFKNSDKVIIAQNPLPTTVKEQKNLDCNLLVSDVNKFGIPASVVTNLADLRERIDEYLEPSSVLLILSNRTCLGLWESDFVSEIH